ncbi:GNAT family N-acetyltransferase [Veronia nyctiphanis]|uniref:GNAT family N-acetyltransferase n=1 Tax=Veronia nyctiphanis TaxID=1278244 RepID=A0A4Q0YUF9_9GAMM|nr:GNAT family N-acetyltransferase [Veronia nyctiphanis]RXJ74425.1 GNAT family N-acetyltransferase [Veronia nyctiphanis]
MKFVPVDLSNNLATCLDFRKDAYRVTFGNTEGYCEKATLQWFKNLETYEDAGFFHLMDGDIFAGQLEFRNKLIDGDGTLFGYINLFYLSPRYRHHGLGEMMQAFAFEAFKAKGCKKARLRFYWRNDIGKAFYLKHGWKPVGSEGERGQLMEKILS